MLGKNLLEDVDASLNVLGLPCRVQEQGNGNGTKALCFRAKNVLVVNLFRVCILFGFEREFSRTEADVLGVCFFLICFGPKNTGAGNVVFFKEIANLCRVNVKFIEVKVYRIPPISALSFFGVEVLRCRKRLQTLRRTF